jgi:hypothetical protein
MVLSTDERLAHQSRLRHAIVLRDRRQLCEGLPAGQFSGLKPLIGSSPNPAGMGPRARTAGDSGTRLPAVHTQPQAQLLELLIVLVA